MSNDSPVFSKEDFINSGYEAVIKAADLPECYVYCTLFFAKSTELGAKGDSIDQRLMNLLGRVTGMHLNIEQNGEPFLPNLTGTDDGPTIPGSISESELIFFNEVVKDILDAELRARVADVLWVRKRDHTKARLAIDSYIASAIKLEDPQNWPPCVTRLQRALQLSISLGRTNQKTFEKVVTHIENLIQRLDGNDPLFLSGKLMEMLLETKSGDATKYAGLAEKAAIRAEGIGNWHLARFYWTVNARWYEQNGPAEINHRAAQYRIAESYVGEGEAALLRTPPSYLVAAHFYEQAIQTHRAIGHSSTRIDELHKILLNYQKRSMSEFKRLSTEINIKEDQDKSIARVTGKSFHDALLALACVTLPPRVNDIKASVKRLAQYSILRYLTPATLVNENGKVVAARPAFSLDSSDEDESEPATKHEMFQYAAQLRRTYAQAVIEPARHQITLEHDFRVNDLLLFAVNNPFVQPGYEMNVATGLSAGLRGDFVIAGHILAIQFETSIRHVISSRTPTSSVDKGGIQKERDLATLLELPQAVEIFGEDRIFELKGLLVEGSGSNLRNLVAHGLIDYQSFLSADFSYLWWLFLQLCCIPYLGRSADPADEIRAEK